MAKTGPASASDEGAKAYHTVFIDTNFDTHMALLVADSDTVSDLKKNIRIQHRQCFPAFGKLKVHAIQVKRKGHLYHLSDSMLVQNAFGGAKKSWFLYVDASCSTQQSLKQQLVKPDDCNNQLALPWVTGIPSNSRGDVPVRKSVEELAHHHDWTLLQPGQGVPSFDQVSQGGSCREIPKFVGAGGLYIDDNCRKILYSASNKRSDSEVQKCDVGSERMASKKKIRDSQPDSSLEGASESGPAAKKKRKTERTESSGKPFEEDKVLTSTTKDVTSNGETDNPVTSLLDKRKNTNAASEYLSTEALEHDNLMTSSISNKKKRQQRIQGQRKTQAKFHDHLVSVVPNVQEIKENRTFKETVGIIHTYPDKVSVVSQKEKHREPVQEVFEGTKGPCSTSSTVVREPDCGAVKGNCVAPHLAAEYDVRETVGSPNYEAAEKKVLSAENNGENLVKKSENAGSNKRKTRSAKIYPARNEDVSIVKHANIAPSTTEREENFLLHAGTEISERKSIEEFHMPATQEGDNLIGDEGDILQATETNRSQEHGEDVIKEKSKECENIGRRKKKKKKAKKFAARDEDASIVNHATDEMIETSSTAPKPSSDGHLIQKLEKEDSTLFNSIEESHMPAGREGGNLIGDEVAILQATETNGEHGAYVKEKSKGCENIDHSRKKKKKAKKFAARDEDAYAVEHATDIDATSTMPNPASYGHLIQKEEKDESTLFDSERKKIPEEKPIHVSHKIGGRKHAHLGNEAELLLSEANRRQENMDGKKRKKVKKSAARDDYASIVEHASDVVIDSAQPNPASDGCLIEKLEKAESSLFHTKETGIPEEKLTDDPLTVPDGERGGVTENEAGSLQTQGQENANEKSRSRGKKSKTSTFKNVKGFVTDEHELDVVHSQLKQVEEVKAKPITVNGVDKKPKQKQSSVVNSHWDLPANAEEVDLEDCTATNAMTNDIHKHARVGNSSNRMEIIYLVKSRTGELEPEKTHDSEHVCSPPEKNLVDACLFVVPPSCVLDNFPEDNTDDQVDVLSQEGEGIDFKQYFLSDQHQKEILPTNKVKDVRRSARLMKTKNTKIHVLPSVGTSPDRQKSLLSNAEKHEGVICSKIFPEAPGNEIKAPNSHHSDHIKTPKKASQSDISTASGVKRSAPAPKGNDGLLIGSSPSSEISDRSCRKLVNNEHELRVDRSGTAVGKFASKNTGEVVKSSQHAKSLLATPGAIFGEDSSNSSADDNGTANSDASTCTPSDKSLSSESEGESESSQDSGRKGSYAAKRTGGTKYLVDSASSDMKNKTIDEILRSSSRFKKAKLTASQLPGDTEIEFVPDSQANP